MNQDYSAGYQHGHEDGKTGKNNLASRSLKRLWQIDQLLPGATNRHDEYRRGYLAGFEDEIRTQKVTITPTPHYSTPTSGQSTMARANNFAYQIELLNELKHFLTEMQPRLLNVAAKYQQKVDQLHDEAGLMDETHRDFVEYQLIPTCGLIQKLVDHIENSDIPAIEKTIKDLEPFL